MHELSEEVATIFGANLSEPHTNQYYEKITVLMYVDCHSLPDQRSSLELGKCGEDGGYYLI